MSKLSNGLLSTAVSGLVLAAGASISTPATSAELLINNYLPPKHPFQLGIVEPWMKAVMESSGGTVTPKLSAARVGPPPKNWQTVTKGLADLVLLANTFQPKRITLPLVAQLPFNSPSAKQTSIALWRSELQHFHKADEFKGAKLLGSFTGSANNLNSGNKPIVDVEDLKGYKIRTSAGLTTSLLKTMGAVPVPSGPGKIYSLVSKGVVDGLTAPGYGLRAFRVMPHINHITVIPGGFTNTSFTWLMNKKKWDGLSKEQQAQVMKVSGEVISNNAERVDKMSAAGLAAFEKKGGKLVTPNAAFMAKLKELAEIEEDKWVKNADSKGIDGKAALAYYKSQL